MFHFHMWNENFLCENVQIRVFVTCEMTFEIFVRVHTDNGTCKYTVDHPHKGPFTVAIWCFPIGVLEYVFNW